MEIWKEYADFPSQTDLAPAENSPMKTA